MTITLKEVLESPLESGQMLVQTTHAMIDMTSRYSVFEYNHFGAKFPDIAHSIEGTYEALGYSDEFEFYFTSVAGEDFWDEIESMQRVRVAQVRLARPNYGWDDFDDHDYEEEYNDFGEFGF